METLSVNLHLDGVPDVTVSKFTYNYGITIGYPNDVTLFIRNEQDLLGFINNLNWVYEAMLRKEKNGND